MTEHPMGYQQICFSRIGNQESGAGWQTFNVTAGVEPKAVDGYETLQSGRTTAPAFDDEDRRSRVVMELCHANGHAFMSRLCYAVNDALGRPSMFAHGYVFDEHRFVRDPQIALRLEDGDFAFTQQDTANPPNPSLMSPLSFAQSMSMLGLAGEQGRERYTNLVMSLYGALTSNANESLTIICDCEPKTIQAVMVVLYAAVPFAMRGRLSFGTYVTNQAQPPTVVFAHRSRGTASASIDLADPAPHANELRDRCRGSKMLAHVIGLLITAGTDSASAAASPLDAEFDAWERAITQLTGSERTVHDAQPFDQLRLYDQAYGFQGLERRADATESKPSVQELRIQLNKLLKAASLANAGGGAFDENIIAALTDMRTYGYPLTKAVADNLNRVLAKSTNQRLQEAGYACLADFIAGQESEQAVETLATIASGDDQMMLRGIFAHLTENAQGMETLADYYVHIGEAHRNDTQQAPSIEFIKNLHDNASVYLDVDGAGGVEGADGAAGADAGTADPASRVRHELRTLCDDAFDAWAGQVPERQGSWQDVWTACMDHVSQLAAAGGFEPHTPEHDGLMRRAGRWYWDNLDIGALDITGFQWDERMMAQDNPRCVNVRKALGAWQAFQQRKAHDFAQGLDSLITADDGEAAALGHKTAQACLGPDVTEPSGVGGHVDSGLLDCWIIALATEHPGQVAGNLLEGGLAQRLPDDLDAWKALVKGSQVLIGGQPVGHTEEAASDNAGGPGSVGIRQHAAVGASDAGVADFAALRPRLYRDFDSYARSTEAKAGDRELEKSISRANRHRNRDDGAEANRLSEQRDRLQWAAAHASAVIDILDEADTQRRQDVEVAEVAEVAEVDGQRRQTEPQRQQAIPAMPQPPVSQTVPMARPSASQDVPPQPSATQPSASQSTQDSSNDVNQEWVYQDAPSQDAKERTEDTRRKQGTGLPRHSSGGRVARSGSHDIPLHAGSGSQEPAHGQSDAGADVADDGTQPLREPASFPKRDNSIVTSIVTWIKGLFHRGKENMTDDDRR